MSTNTPVPTVPKVRTFAADLSEARAERGITTPVPKQPVVTKTKIVPPERKIEKTTPPPITKSATVKVAPRVPTPTVAPHVADEAAIPPFHTLNKTNTPVKTIDTSAFGASSKAVKPSVLAGPGEEPLAVNSRDNSNDGTIITDTKRNRFSLFGAIQDSLAAWFQKRKRTALRRKVPTYTVPEADRRKGIIQKATTQTGRTSTADHQAALSRIKSSQKTVRRTSATTTTPATSHSPSIEPFAEVTAEDSEATPRITVPPVVAAPVVAATIIPTLSPEPVIRPLITPVIPDLPVAEIVPPIDSTATEIKSIADKLHELEERTALTESPAPTTSTIVQSNEPEPVITPLARPRITPTIPTVPSPILENEPEPELESAPEEQLPEEATTPDTTPRPNWSQSIAPATIATTIVTRNAGLLRALFMRTNHVALGVAGGISVVIIGWYGIQAIRTLGTTPAAVTESRSGAFLTISTIIATTTTITDKESFLRTLRAVDTSSDSLTEIVITDEVTKALLSPPELLKILGARVNNNFIAAIDRVGFGNYRGTPWLILHSNDSPAVQGGMLAWENNLDTDLSPWYSTSTLKATKKGITLFHDGTIAGHDVRVLSDGDGKERVVYGFISPHQLLITNNSTTFLNLADKGTAD